MRRHDMGEGRFAFGCRPGLLALGAADWQPSGNGPMLAVPVLRTVHHAARPFGPEPERLSSRSAIASTGFAAGRNSSDRHRLDMTISRSRRPSAAISSRRAAASISRSTSSGRLAGRPTGRVEPLRRRNGAGVDRTATTRRSGRLESQSRGWPRGIGVPIPRGLSPCPRCGRRRCDRLPSAPQPGLGSGWRVHVPVGDRDRWCVPCRVPLCSTTRSLSSDSLRLARWCVETRKMTARNIAT